MSECENVRATNTLWVSSVPPNFTGYWLHAAKMQEYSNRPLNPRTVFD